MDKFVQKIVLIGLLLQCFSSYAETLIIGYDSSGTPTLPDPSIATHLLVSSGLGLSVVSAPVLTRSGWATESFLIRSYNDYIQFGVTDIVESIEPTRYKFAIARSFDGPRNFRIEISTDGGSSFQLVTEHININVLGFGTAGPVSIPSITTDDQILFRLYGWNALSSTGTLSLDWSIEGVSLGFDGNVVPVLPVATAITTFIQTTDPIGITFSESVTADPSFVSLDCMVQGDNQPYNITTNSSTVIEITPVANLLNDDVCDVFIDLSKVTDTNGFVGQGTVSGFVVPPNAQPPTIEFSSPIEGGVVSSESNIEIQFSEPILPPTDGGGNVLPYVGITCNAVAAGGSVLLTKYEDLGINLLIDPNPDLPNGADCLLTLTGVTDVFSNSLTVNTISFSTATLGDVNLDGLVNLGDAIILERAILGLDTLTSEQENVADLAPAGGDNAVSLNDLLELQRILLGI